jgi:polar amino acid transport system substrate-binding protein
VGVSRWRLAMTSVGLILAGCVFGAAGPEQPKHLRLCADLWCPYNCAPDARDPGYAVEIVQRVFARFGYRIDYSLVAWTRCIEDARAGRFDGIIAAIPSDAPEFTFPHHPIGLSADGFAARANAGFSYRGVASLEGHVLGVTRDYAFSGEAGAYVRAHANDPSRIELVSGQGALAKNLAKLAAGHIDLVLDDANVLRNAIAEQGYAGKLVVVKGMVSDPVYIAFSPADADRTEWAAILDHGLDRLRASGVLAAILAKYDVPPDF